MTRTHKISDRDHVGLANGTASPEQQQHLPRFYGKAAYTDTNPGSSKKQGGGKGNWGTPGSELEDTAYNSMKPRRRTNSFSRAAGHSPLKTKWEDADPQESVFYDEDLHGPSYEDLLHLEMTTSTVSNSSSMDSVEEEEEADAVGEQRGAAVGEAGGKK